MLMISISVYNKHKNVLQAVLATGPTILELISVILFQRVHPLKEAQGKIPQEAQRSCGGYGALLPLQLV